MGRETEERVRTTERENEGERGLSPTQLVFKFNAAHDILIDKKSIVDMEKVPF